MILENLAWIGSLLLAFCSVPQAIKSIYDGHSDGLSWGFILMWFLGEIFTVGYVIAENATPLILNYTANILFLLVIIKYKIWKRIKHE